MFASLSSEGRNTFPHCLHFISSWYVLILILLSGCATPQAPNTVYVQVPTPCVKKEDAPTVPTMLPNADLAKLDDYALVITIAAERLALAQYAKEANALISACVK